MKNLLLFYICCCIFLCGCKKNEEPFYKEEGGDCAPSFIEKKVLTGTFVQLFGKDHWSEAQWEAFLSEIKSLGMNTLIVQYTAFKNAYNDITWFDSQNTFTIQKSKNTLARLLKVAENQGIEVYLGLYFDETYWQHQTDASWLELHARYCIEIAQELQSQFGNSKAFKGWYIPHEPEPDAYHTDEKIALFRDVFINPIAHKLHQWGNKPISIAAFWNSALTSPEQLQHFMAELSKSPLNIIMLQDGVGAGHVTLEQLKTYYLSAEKGLFIENPNYKGAFWTDLETFAYTPTPPYPPATFDRVEQQLMIELAIPRISKAVSFQYYDDMSNWSPNKAQADDLRNKYQLMLNKIK